MEALPRRELDSPQTPLGLLHRLREHPDDAEAWQCLDAWCRPLLLTWLRQYSIQPQDAHDIVQEVLGVSVRDLSKYDSRKGSYPAWLRGILSNRLREFWRSKNVGPFLPADSATHRKTLNQLEDPRSDPRRLRERERAQDVVQRLLARVRPDFEASTLEAFERVMAGEKPMDVAADLGISVNSVYLAKSSILRRLRQEMDTLTN